MKNIKNAKSETSHSGLFLTPLYEVSGLRTHYVLQSLKL